VAEPAAAPADRPASTGADAGEGKFDADTAVWPDPEAAPAGDGAGAEAGRTFAAVVSGDWRAGRGPHGGYLAAMILRALGEGVDAGDGRSPRSLTIHYAKAPEPGPVRITTRVERAGRSLSTLSARMEQDGRLVALALSAFSVPWSGPSNDELPMPEVAPPEPEGDAEPEHHPQAPPIARRVRLQRRFGSRPFAPGGEMEIGGWLGHSERRPIDALSLAFFSDALIPAPFMYTGRPNPAPTIDLSVHFRATVPHLQDGVAPDLCLIRIRSRLIQDGFFEEDGVMWAPDGTVLAQSRQLALLMDTP
jgi:acyl-CoA thioesterase